MRQIRSPAPVPYQTYDVSERLRAFDVAGRGSYLLDELLVYCNISTWAIEGLFQESKEDRDDDCGLQCLSEQELVFSLEERTRDQRSKNWKHPQSLAPRSQRMSMENVTYRKTMKKTGTAKTLTVMVAVINRVTCQRESRLIALAPRCPELLSRGSKEKRSLGPGSLLFLRRLDYATGSD